MQSNNMSSSQAVVSGTIDMPDFYNTQLHLTQPPNTQNNFGNQLTVPMQQFTNAAPLPVFSLPTVMQQQSNNPTVDLSSNVQCVQQMPQNNAGNIAVNPLLTPTQTTQFQFPPLSQYQTIYAPAQSPYFSPTMTTAFCFPTGTETPNVCMAMPSAVQAPMQTTPPLNPDPSPNLLPMPQPAGYVTNLAPMQPTETTGLVQNIFNDSGQVPGFPQAELWKNDPAQTPQVQPVFAAAIPNYSNPGTYYLQTPKGIMVQISPARELPTDVSSEATTVRNSPSHSVESRVSTNMVDTPMMCIPQNQIGSPTIQNFGNVSMEFMGQQQRQQQIQQQSNNDMQQQYIIEQNGLLVQQLQQQLLQQQQQLAVAMHLPLPQREAPATLNNQSNYTDQSESHRGRSRSQMNRSPPGFMEDYKTHRVQNIARENPNQPSNNFKTRPQAPPSLPTYGGRGSNDVRRNNMDRNDNNQGQQNNRRRSPRERYGGRRNRNGHSSGAPVPMVNAARQNKRRRRESNKRNTGDRVVKKRTKRYGYRTKQDKIEEVYTRVTDHFRELGYLVSEDHGIRGETVARVHIKKWLSLVKIEEAIAKVMADPCIQTIRVSAPVSMKNQYQKKGFLMYWQTETVEGLNRLMGHFKSFDEKDEDGSWKMDEFQKISVAIEKVEQDEHQNVRMDEKASSPGIETYETKAVVASSLTTRFAELNITHEEEATVPFQSSMVFAEANNQKTNNTVVAEKEANLVKKPEVSEKLAFDEEDEGFFEDFDEAIHPPAFMKIASNCSICSIGA